MEAEDQKLFTDMILSFTASQNQLIQQLLTMNHELTLRLVDNKSNTTEQIEKVMQILMLKHVGSVMDNGAADKKMVCKQCGHDEFAPISFGKQSELSEE